jgi:hypothetical protein
VIWREDVVLLRMPALRLRFRRSQWEVVRRLRVGVGTHTVEIDVVILDEPSVHGGRRRWLRCVCGRRTSVIGLVCTTGQVGCRACLGWRSRSNSVMSPYVVHASAGIVTHAEAPGAQPHDVSQR